MARRAELSPFGKPRYEHRNLDADLLEVGPPTGVDTGDDGVSDVCDVRPEVSDPGRSVSDADGIGDMCEACPNDWFNGADGDCQCADVDPCPLDPIDDSDTDGFSADDDNCPDIANPDQTDSDLDLVGDICDSWPGGPDLFGVFKDGFETGDFQYWVLP